MKPNAILAIALFANAPAAAPTAAAPATKPAAPAAAPSTVEHVEAAPLDIDTAAVEQLAAAESLDKTLAEAIVKNRPYESVGELVKAKISSEAAFVQAEGGLTTRQN
jgi:competence protein ComEA